MKLEVKHLAPYLPYALKVQYIVRDKVEKTGYMRSISHNEDEAHPTRVSINHNYEEHIWMFKPILKPISDLKSELILEHFKYWEEVEFYGNSFSIKGKGMIMQGYDFDDLPYTLVQKLLEFHFDLFGLIEKGLAVDINTLSVE